MPAEREQLQEAFNTDKAPKVSAPLRVICNTFGV